MVTLHDKCVLRYFLIFDLSVVGIFHQQMRLLFALKIY